MTNSLLDLAEEFLKENKGEASFKDIWSFVVKKAELNEEEARNSISRFYTNLLLDGRFVTLGENVWDLRTRQKFDKVHIDMKDVYNDDDDYESSDPEEFKDEEEFGDYNEDKNNNDSDENEDNDEDNENNSSSSEEF